MRTNILTCIFSLLFFVSGCDLLFWGEPLDGADHSCILTIQNNSGQNLVLEYLDGPGMFWMKKISLLSQDSVVFSNLWSSTESEEDFDISIEDSWLKKSGISLFSTDSVLLKHWDYAFRDSTGRQFFNSRDWKIKREWEEGNDTYREWVFEILPEDIAGVDQ